MQDLLLIARIVVLLFALLGAGGSVVFGLVGRATAAELRDSIERDRWLWEDEDEGHQAGGREADPRPRELEQTVRSIPFLLAGGLLGLIGGVLAVAGRTGSGGVWLLAAGIGPAIIHPVTLCFNFGLVVAGLLSLLAWLLAVTTEPRSAS